jgi:hypothetical protein
LIPNNALDFDEENHVYTRNDEEYTSVTTFIDEFFPGFDAEAVAEKKAYSYGKYSDKSKEEVLDMWQQKADDGTRVHEEIEKWLMGLDSSEYTKKTEQAIKFWTNELTENYFIHRIKPELQVYHDDYKLAGTIDVAFKHNSKGQTAKRQVSLIDWKTNKGIYKTAYNDGETGTHAITQSIPDSNWHHYSLQLSLYAYILEDQFDQNIYKLNLVHLKQDDYEIHDIPYRKETVKKLCAERLK